MDQALRISRKERIARILGLCITICLISVIMSSCAGKKPAEQFDLEIVTFYDSPAEADAFNALIRQFEKATKLRVYAESLPRETYYTSLEQYMSSDYPPDILAFHPGWYFRNYAAKGLIAPIETALPSKKFEKAFPACFKQVSQYNGTIVFMPISWTWWALYYNKQAFATAGLGIPASFEELSASAQALRKAGIIPFTASAKDSDSISAWIALLLSTTEAPELYDAFCSGTLPYTDSKVQSALQNLSIFIKNKYIIDSATMLSPEQALGPLVSGKAALYLASAGLAGKIPQEARGTIGVLPFPIGKNKASIYADIEGLVMHAKAKHKANAEKFISFMASAEAQSSLSLPFSRYPAVSDNKAGTLEQEQTKALARAATTMQLTLERMTPPNAANTIVAELKAIFALPGNLQLYLQNLEAKRAELYRKK